MEREVRRGGGERGEWRRRDKGRGIGVGIEEVVKKRIKS